MAPLSRSRQLFLYIAPFPALAFFKIWASFDPSPPGLRLVSLILFIYCLLILVIARRWDKPTYFDWVITIYFAAIFLVLVIQPTTAGRYLSRYSVTGIYACLFAAAFFPPLVGMAPFTCHYAQKSTPRDFWENPIFIQVNRLMTYVWAGIFAACLLLSLYPSVFTRAIIPLGLILGLGLPFNRRFPDYYLKRMGLPSLAEQKRLAAEVSKIVKPEPATARLPESTREVVSRMPDFFNPSAAGSLEAVIGFIVSGAENFEVYLVIQDGYCQLETSPSRKADLLIRTPADVWLAIARGELDGQQAFFQQAFQAEGDLSLLLRLKILFSGRETSTGSDLEQTGSKAVSNSFPSKGEKINRPQS